MTYGEACRRELHLTLEIGMLVHKIQEIVVYDRKLLPYHRADIPVIIHVAMKDICHIYFFLRL